MARIHMFARGTPGAQLLVKGDSGFIPRPDVDMSAIGARSAVFSRDGGLLAVLTHDGVAVYNLLCDPMERVALLPRPAVTNVAFSPLSTFIVTWEKLVEGSDGNLILWRLGGEEGAVVVSRLKQKNFARDKWPSTPWTMDEALSLQLVTGEVLIFDGKKGPGASPAAGRLKLERVSKIAIAPITQPYRFATVVPEQQGAPAVVRIYDYPKLIAGAYRATKSFFKASSVDLLWSPSGEGLLALARTDEDRTGRSYYGESNLFYLTAESQGGGSVPLSKEGALPVGALPHPRPGEVWAAGSRRGPRMACRPSQVGVLIARLPACRRGPGLVMPRPATTGPATGHVAGGFADSPASP